MGPCSFNVRKHQNLEERLGAARKLLEHFSLPPQCQLVADCMDNNANVAYGVSNERVCIVQQRKIAYLGGKGPFFYNLKEVRQWLEHSYGKRQAHWCQRKGKQVVKRCSIVVLGGNIVLYIANYFALLLTLQACYLFQSTYAILM